MTSATLHRFGDLYAEPSKNGVTRPSRVRGSGHPMVNMGEMFAYPRLTNPQMELVPMTAAELTKFNLRSGDLLFARQSLILEGAGKCSVVKDVPDDTTFESHLIRVRLDAKIADPDYFFYYLNSAVTPVKSIVTQGVQAGIRASELSEIKVLVPGIETQRRIADILCTYDDLIENNRRRIKLLEEAARLIYREWFVHLRFPGHENTKIENGVPEGWDSMSIWELAEVLSGGTPKTNNPAYWDGDIPFFTPKDTGDTILVLATEKLITEGGLKKCNSKLYPPRTVFITARGTVGKVRMPLVPMAMNQTNYALRGKDELPQEYLFFAVENSVSAFKSQAAGSVFDAIVVDTFKKIQVLRPPKALLSEFCAIASPVLDQTGILMKQSSLLRDARDLLLPRLMSGEIEV